MVQQQQYTVGRDLHVQDVAIALRVTDGELDSIDSMPIGQSTTPALVNEQCQRVTDLEELHIDTFPGNPEDCTIFANVDSGNWEVYANQEAGTFEGNWVPIFGIERAENGYQLTAPKFSEVGMQPMASTAGAG